MIYSFAIDIPEIESKLQCALNTLTPWYSANRLSISAQKSAVILIGKKSRFKHSNLAVSINGNRLEQVCSTKYLGATVDNTLSWDSQCDNLCCKLAGKIAVLRRIRSFVKTETLKLLYEKTIKPVMDYACSVWCHTKKSDINKLQRVQNYAARIITDNFDYLNTNSIDLIRSLRWANVQEKCDYFTAVLMYQAIHGLTPMYMTDNIVMAGETHDRDTRLSDSNDVNIPPIIQMYSNGHLSITAVSSATISLVKLGWLSMCQILSGGTNVFVWNPFLFWILCLKADDVHLHASWLKIVFILYVILYRCLKLVYLHVCLLSYLWFYCIIYQIKWNYAIGQHGRTVVWLNAITLYKYIWKIYMYIYTISTTICYNMFSLSTGFEHVMWLVTIMHTFAYLLKWHSNQILLIDTSLFYCSRNSFCFLWYFVSTHLFVYMFVLLYF